MKMTHKILLGVLILSAQASVFASSSDTLTKLNHDATQSTVKQFIGCGAGEEGINGHCHCTDGNDDC